LLLNQCMQHQQHAWMMQPELFIDGQHHCSEAAAVCWGVVAHRVSCDCCGLVSWRTPSMCCWRAHQPPTVTTATNFSSPLLSTHLLSCFEGGLAAVTVSYCHVSTHQQFVGVRCVAPHASCDCCGLVLALIIACALVVGGSHLNSHNSRITSQFLC
jgi:hypothetical protein